MIIKHYDLNFMFKIVVLYEMGSFGSFGEEVVFVVFKIIFHLLFKVENFSTSLFTIIK